MCGICGIVDYRKNSIVEEKTISNMCEELRHRGPDDGGVYLSNGAPSVGLGHRRLSIIDLSQAGHQPMRNEDGSVWLVFNGEIYNYRYLRDELKKQGHIFKSDSDTEVMIHLYETYGEECISRLRGMFAFAIWDNKKKILILGRDRVGKKPLLYFHDKGRFVFASEFTPLLGSNFIEKSINYQAIDYYLTFGYIPAPLTIYDKVFKLLPAHILILKDNNLTIKPYWQLDYSKKIKISEEDAAHETLRLLREAVKIRLYSDVSLGAFLSGGIDSSTVVALMAQEYNQKVKTFSIGFEEKDYNELKYAKNIANRFNTEHHEFIVKPDAVNILPLLVERYGEPYADSSCIPTYYVARETKKYATVTLNGDGGDEVFGGYERYQAMAASETFQAFPAFLKYAVNGVIKIVPDSINSKNSIRRLKRFFDGAELPTEKRYLRWINIFNEKLKDELYSDDFKNKLFEKDSLKWINVYLQSEGVDLIDRLLKVDVNTYLPNDLLVKVDITSMANSLEARSPFLDHKLMEFAASLPSNYKIKGLVKKYILKKAIKDIVPSENINRKKMGFGVPVGEWIRGDLKKLTLESLLSKKSLIRGYFKSDYLENMIDAHIERKTDYTFQIWALLMLELWHERFIDK